MSNEKPDILSPFNADAGSESPEPPHGELQPIIDHLERSIYDEDFDDSDDDFDWDEE